MDKVYSHKNVEKDTYKKWEEKGYFKPEINFAGDPYAIVLPPPNANGSLHFGHAMMVLEDILIRYKRMQGFATLWIPGADHAGFETQFVFEKNLA
ncbi:MAG TPA: class I tRNA ligase family protein, partial [Candidatus Levybacteria bacterium]|nr:class I tRNA ligase family protein [Candidatus Levybacteria bacterium]